MAHPRLRVHWLVPYPIRGSGGHRTIFQHVRSLVGHGHECVMHVQAQDPHDPSCPTRSAEELDHIITSWFFDTGARIVPSWERLEPCDVLFATLWESASRVQRAPVGKRKAYFVQDYEAYFSPMGDGFLGAENSYRAGLEHITIGRWLTHVIRDEFGGSANYFDFTADERVYHPALESKTAFPSVAFLYQPEKPRRCPWLGRETLGIVKHRMPEARIYLYGTAADAKEIWFPVERCGLLSTAECAALYQRCHVGLCISSSNPSRIPFEMMAAGCAVVDIDRPNNRHDYERDAISLVGPTPEALAGKIIELLSNAQLREQQIHAGLEMMKRRPARLECDRFHELVLQLWETGSVEGPRALGAAPTSEPAAPARPTIAAQVHAHAPPSSNGDGRLRSALDAIKRRGLAFARDLRREATWSVERARGRRGLQKHTSYVRLEDTVLEMAAGKKAVGFDVFDTLVRRRVEPDVIKELTAREMGRLLGKPASWEDLLGARRRLERALCLRNQRSGFDDEFQYDEMLHGWVADAGAPSGERASIAAELARFEERMELSAQEGHPAVARLLLELKRRGLRLLFVSDFYLPVATIRMFLQRVGLASFFDAGYASSSGLLRKASGRLFHHVLAEERLSPKELLFVGDNLYSDVHRPNEIGIDAVRILDSGERARAFRLEVSRSLARHNPYWKGAVAEQIVTGLGSAKNRGDGPRYELGRKLAPAFALFAEHIVRAAFEGSFGAIFFCAREGLPFLRLVRALLAGRPRHERPALRYLAASRRSTFLPSMRGLTLDELGRFLGQYSNLSGAQILDCIGLPREELEPVLRRVGFGDIDRPIPNVRDYTPLHRFVEDEEARTLFAEHHGVAVDLFTGYLRQRGFFDHDRVLVVDVGWKGSIIDNVARAIATVPGAPNIEGLLFGAEEGITTSVVPKRGYFFHGPERDPVAYAGMTNVALFEMHATAHHGTTVAYRRRRGRIQGVTRYFDEERRNWETNLRDGQRGVADYFREYVRARPLLQTAFDSSPDEWLQYERDRIRSLINHPSASDASAFMSASHVESFGLFSVRSFGAEKPTVRDKLDGRSVPNVDDLYRAVRFTVWPAGMLRRMKLGFLMPAYDAYDAWHRTHKW